jgi:hypothetical protein
MGRDLKQEQCTVSVPRTDSGLKKIVKSLYSTALDVGSFIA